jgi:Beta protein
MPDFVYVPVLKGCQGEFAALGKIQPITRSGILPLVEIVPGNSDEPATIREAVDRGVKKLRPWAGSSVMLDSGLLPTEILLGDVGASGYAARKSAEFGINAIPVVRLADGPVARKDIGECICDYGTDVAIRLNLEDMDEDPEDIDSAIISLLREINAPRSSANLILDLGVINGDIAVRAGSRVVYDFLRDLEKVDEWKTIVVAGGAFPVDLSAIAPWSFGEAQRYDAALWDAIRGRRRIPRIPIYGDYAIAYPLLISGPPFPPAPQLRYTLSDRWLIVKGRRNDPRGNEQFCDVCDFVAAHPEFAGTALGAADARIADSRDQGPGNGATWREIGTTHHLDYVTSRITNLGEP